MNIESDKKRYISHKNTWTWLRKGNFERLSQSLLKAAKNNTISTNYVKAKLDMTQQNRKCRLCGERDETINLTISKHRKMSAKTV